MNRFLTLATLAVSVLGMLGAAQQPTFRGTGEAVRVFVTVTDRDGARPALTQDDFEVRDEGKPQPVTLFDNTPQPIRLIVMLDVSAAWKATCRCFAPARTAVRAASAGRSGASACFGTRRDHQPHFHARSRGAADSAADVNRARCPDLLWRGIDDAIKVFGQEDGGRPVILVLSDGKDSGPMNFSQGFITQVDVIDHARAGDVMVYGIGMRSRGRRPMTPGVGREGCRRC